MVTASHWLKMSTSSVLVNKQLFLVCHPQCSTLCRTGTQLQLKANLQRTHEMQPKCAHRINKGAIGFFAELLPLTGYEPNVQLMDRVCHMAQSSTATLSSSTCAESEHVATTISTRRKICATSEVSEIPHSRARRHPLHHTNKRKISRKENRMSSKETCPQMNGRNSKLVGKLHKALNGTRDAPQQ